MASFGLTKSRLESVFYYRISDTGKLIFIVTCQVDNYIYAETEDEMARFESKPKSTFKVGELKTKSFEVYSSKIFQQPDKSIRVTQDKKMSQFAELELPKSSLEKGSLPASPKQLQHFMGAVGFMLFIARVSCPLITFYASDQTSRASKQQVHHLKTLNSHIRYLKKTHPELNFLPRDEAAECVLDVYSDASLPAK